MKRTKTFVTKFLSVLVLGAVVLSSCTKDLEDRLGKVEETLKTVVSDAASLKAELDKMSAKKDVTLTGVTDATGKTTLTFTNAAGVASTIVFEDKNDKAVVTVEDNKPTAGFTTVTVDGKAFTYQSTVPNSVTSISLTNSVKTLAVFEGAQFKLNYKFNTNDGSSVDGLIKPSNVAVVAGATKAASALAVAPFTVTAVERVGTTNEYELTFTASSISTAAAAGVYGIKIQLNNADKTVSSEFVDVTLTAMATANALKHNTTAFASTPGALVAAGSVVVNVDETTGVYTEVLSNVKFVAEHDGGTVFNVGDIEGLTVKVYEYTVAYTGNDYYIVSNANPITNSAFDTWVSTAANGVKDVSSLAKVAPTADGKSYTITLDATAAAKTITGYNTKTFLVTIDGKTVSTNGKYFRAAGTYEVTKRMGFTMTAVAPKYVAETSSSVYKFTQTYTAKKYSELTGAANISNATTSSKVYDSEGTEVASGVTTTTAKLDAFDYLEYTVTLDQSKFKAGVYKVVTSIVENGKTYEFIQSVTITRPTSGVKTATPAAATGYAVTGNAASFDSYLPTFNVATKAITAVVKEFDVKKVFAHDVVVPTGGASVVEDTNFKLFYALYTLGADGKTKTFVTGAPVFGNVAWLDTPTTTFTASEAGTGANTIAYDKTYNVDVYVVYASGFKDEINTSFTVTYKTRPITGFLSTTGDAAVFSKTLARALTYGNTTDVISVANMKDGKKAFHFGNEAKVSAIVVDEAVPVKDAFYYVIDKTIGITYAVEKVKVTAENIASFTAASGQSVALNDELSFITTGGTNTAALSFAEVRTEADAILKFAADTKVQALTAPVKQIVIATVTDIWGIAHKFNVEVTINPTK